MELRLQGCASLKEKRHLIRGMIQRTRQNFHVSIAEVGDTELWGNATIMACFCSNSTEHAMGVLMSVLNAFDARPDLDVASYSTDVWRPS